MLSEFQSDTAPALLDEFLQNFDHHSDFYRKNFFGVIGRIAERKIGAIRSQQFDDGFSIATNYNMIRKVTDRPDLFTNLQGYRVVPRTVMPVLFPSDMDGEDHAFMRKVLNPLFSPRRVAEYRESVQADINRISAELIERGSWDWATDFAQPVTGRVTMRLLGLAEEEWDAYALPIHNAAFCIGSVESRIAGAQDFASKVHEEVTRLVRQPDAPGLIGHLARLELDGRRISIDDIEKAVLNIIIGGLDTTQATFSCAAVYLARHPERRQELRAHPERIRNATLEFLRVFASAPMTGRYNIQDVEIDGHVFPQDQATLLFWSAANFDPEFIERPMDMDFTRSSGRNMTFAAGPHSCLGQHLSKLELEAMIACLVQTDYELDEHNVVVAEDVSAAIAYLNVPCRLGAPLTDLSAG
jgi:cytochrome P450